MQKERKSSREKERSAHLFPNPGGGIKNLRLSQHGGAEKFKERGGWERGLSKGGRSSLHRGLQKVGTLLHNPRVTICHEAGKDAANDGKGEEEPTPQSESAGGGFLYRKKGGCPTGEKGGGKRRRRLLPGASNSISGDTKSLSKHPEDVTWVSKGCLSRKSYFRADWKSRHDDVRKLKESRIAR